jgi:hypothetical protein
MSEANEVDVKNPPTLAHFSHFIRRGGFNLL